MLELILPHHIQSWELAEYNQKVVDGKVRKYNLAVGSLYWKSPKNNPLFRGLSPIRQNLS